MAEVTEKQPEVQKPELTPEENLFSDISIDEMLDKHSTVIYDENEKKPEIAEPEKKLETEVKEEKSEEPKSTELKPEESMDQLYEKYPVLSEHKKAYENREKWNESLTQKGQFISWFNKLTPEQQEAVVLKNIPTVYGKEELPKIPAELVNDFVGKIEVGDVKYVDKDEFEVQVPGSYLTPIIKEKVKAALENVAPEMVLLRKQNMELTDKIKKMEGNLSATQLKLGNTEATALVSKHKMLDISRVNDNEGILDAVSRILNAGVDHPEYDKVLMWKAVFNASDDNNWPLEKSFGKLYGGLDRKMSEKEKSEEVTKQNQKNTQQETPTGVVPKKVEDWEDAMEGIGDRSSKIDDFFPK